MGTVILAFALAAASSAGRSEEVAIPEHGPLVVAGDVRVRSGRYVRPPLGDDGRSGVIVARGLRNATIDLRGVELLGAEPGTELDELRGWGLVLTDCENVTVRGGRLGGYKGCLVAERCSGLVVEDVTFEGWFAQRLLSTAAGENPADWLWPHDNDGGEWTLSYGAAISLTDCADSVVRRARGRRGQNGILLTRSARCQIYDNDFSFLSGWGLGLYRSCGNVVCRNVFDYCVRGFSHGVYWRGQDSAGILMFERCSDNVIALNSATHGGDGLFLFAGRDSVDGRAFERGETDVGGSDRNVFWRNDFSHAVANAIETTFSRDNVAVGNLCRGSHQHGVWAGYSARMRIADNDFTGTAGGGVTIEHGQECVLARNVFHGCGTGVELYWDEDPQFVQGPYGERYDTASRGHRITANSFAGNGADLAVDRTTGLVFGDNVLSSETGELHVSEVRAGGEGEEVSAEAFARFFGGRKPSGRITRSELAEDPGEAPPIPEWTPPSADDLPGEQVAFDPHVEDGQGLETIVMGEWGPWDFRGGEPRPEPRLPGGELAGTAWETVWFSWAAGPDPIGNPDGWRSLAARPLARGTVDGWADPWGSDAGRRSVVGAARFGLIARAEVELPAGRYELEVTSDDGVRVRVDGKTALQNWTWHGPTVDRAEIDLTGGAHVFELEYFQIDGAVALAIELRRRSR